MPHKKGHKKEKKEKRVVTETGEDITGLTPEERQAAILKSGFETQDVSDFGTPSKTIDKPGFFSGQKTDKPSGIQTLTKSSVLDQNSPLCGHKSLTLSDQLFKT